MNSLIEQIETWITNLIDQRIALAKPRNIEEISEARVIELINELISEARVMELINGCFDSSSPEDLGMNMDYYLHEDSDLNYYLNISDYEDEIREIVNNTFETKSIDILIPQ